MRINLVIWLWVFVLMSLLMTIITVSLLYIYTTPLIAVSSPKYAFYCNHKGGEKFDPMKELESIGYKRTEVDAMDWDLLWTHEYPFKSLSHLLTDLKNYQKINHWPGNAAVVNKVDISTSNDFSFIPRSFRIPRDLKDYERYSVSNDNSKYLQKNIFHRNVSILRKLEKDSENVFIQELVPNPYLIDGYKFDIGVIALMTSVNPLRLYLYDDIVLRFCLSKYTYGNFDNRDSYVVRKKYWTVEDIPELDKFSQNQSQKQTLDSYLRDKNKNPNLVWAQIEKYVREVFLKREQIFIDTLDDHVSFSGNSYENYFEIYKLDFLLTDSEDLKIWMMEVNMSPIIAPLNIITNAMTIIQTHVPNYVKSDEIDPLFCKVNGCDGKQCSEECDVCSKCSQGRKKVAMESAYQENRSEGRRFKRIFPLPITSNFNLEEELQSVESEMNQFMTRWYFEKCKTDSKWCE